MTRKLRKSFIIVALTSNCYPNITLKDFIASISTITNHDMQEYVQISVSQKNKNILISHKTQIDHLMSFIYAALIACDQHSLDAATITTFNDIIRKIDNDILPLAISPTIDIATMRPVAHEAAALLNKTYQKFIDLKSSDWSWQTMDTTLLNETDSSILQIHELLLFALNKRFDLGIDINVNLNLSQLLLYLIHQNNVLSLIDLLQTVGFSADLIIQRAPYLLHDAVTIKVSDQVLTTLLDLGFPPDACDQHQWTPLMRAAQSNNVNAIKILLQKGAQIDTKNQRDETALFIAISHDSIAALQELLERGANKEIRNSRQDTPLIMAVAQSRKTSVKLLLEARPDINAQGNHKDTALIRAIKTAAYYTQYFKLKPFIDIINILLNHQAHTELKNEEGQTPLFIAAKYGELAILLKVLIDAEADKEARDIHGNTPLIAATAAGKINNVAVLLEAKADTHKTNDNGQTAYDIAKNKGYEEIMRLLTSKD
jgi:ankyrin repeat protein